MKPTPEQVERAREIIAQYKRQNMGAPMPSIEERRANLEMAIAQALADEAERARMEERERCARVAEDIRCTCSEYAKTCEGFEIATAIRKME